MVERPVNQHNSISHYWIHAPIKHRDLGVDPDQQALRKAWKGNVAHYKPNRIVTADLSTPQDELTHAIECQKREDRPFPKWRRTTVSINRSADHCSQSGGNNELSDLHTTKAPIKEEKEVVKQGETKKTQREIDR